MKIDLKLHDYAAIKDKLSVNDKMIISDRIKAGPKKTRIVFTNADTGEVLGEFENKVVISGSNENALRMFGLDPIIEFPTYNEEMVLDGTVDKGTERLNDEIVCLFCVSDSGCGALPKDVYTVPYTGRIKPAPINPVSYDEFTSDMIMPFRWVDESDDLNEDLRKYYFGRKTYSNLGKIGYYFKSFDTTPQLHLIYADGTQITSNVYTDNSDQEASCYIDMRLRITRLDFRDYFEQVLGWDKARISSLSLCMAWNNTGDDGYTYFQEILPYTMLYFTYQQLVSTDVAIDVLYEVYY